MPFVRQKRIMAIALESTAGTAATVDDAQFNIRLRDIEFDPEIEAYLTWFASGRHSQSGSIMGKRRATVSCKYDMRTGAAAGTAPTARKLFLACGASENDGASTVAYTPAATADHGNNINATIKVMDIPVSGNALVYTIKGAMGNMVISMDDLSQPLVAMPTFQGALVSIADGTALTLTSPDTGNAPAVIGATITHASTAQKIGKFQLDFGNDVQLEYDPSDATGYLAAYIAKREPKLRIDPQASLVATDAHYTRWAAGTEAAFSLATSAVGGIRWTVAAPKAQLIGYKIGDRNGSVIFDQEYGLHESSGNDEWSITQSA